MASKSRVEGTLKRTGRPSKQEPEWNPTFPSNIARTPDHYGPQPRRTTEPRRETFPSSFESRSASSAISANFPSTNYEFDHEDQPESLAPTTNPMTQLPPQKFERSTAPWVSTSRELHMHKKPMDFELSTRLANIRCQADGNSSTSSSPQASLALLGSSASITSSVFSQSFSVASPPPAVEFPPTPVFTDAIPACFMRKLDLLSIGQAPKAPALTNLYPLQSSHTVIATRSLDTTHEVDSSSSASSSPNSTPRQQYIQLPDPPKSVPYYTPNPSHYTPPRQTKTPKQTTPSSNTAQQPSGLTSASTAPGPSRATKPLPAQTSNHSPPPMISPEHNPPSPLNRESIKTWWNQFIPLIKSPKGDPFEGPYRALDTADHPVFGKPLRESLQCASVRISTANANGNLYVWGYVPTVIAKCGLYLKYNASEVPGIFNVSGSNRRMRDLQTAFESPPRYGKSLDWKQESYTTHDVAGVFQRYLAQLPEPVIPYDLYHPFRDALAKEPFNEEQVITTYKSLVRRMPRANQYLFLYVLDLLSVFARKSGQNLMTATNLAGIFRPSVISHPKHEMLPKEHALSQRVLEFLIAQQDWFMVDISPLDNDDKPKGGGKP